MAQQFYFYIEFVLGELIFYLFEVKLYLFCYLRQSDKYLYACAMGTGRAGRVDERIYRCRSIIIPLGQQLLY
jgi:hypothetical protein